MKKENRRSGERERKGKSGSKSFGRIWFSAWWPVLLVMVFFMAAGTCLVYELQGMIEEEKLTSFAETHRQFLEQMEQDYEKEAQNDPKAAYENAMASLRWDVNSVSEEMIGAYVCNRQGEVVAEREPALYLRHMRHIEDENDVTQYYRCADEAMEQRVLEAYEAYLKKPDSTALSSVIRIDEAYISGNECYPVRVNIYSILSEGELGNARVYFHLQETIVSENELEADYETYLTGLDFIEDGESIGRMGEKTSEAREAGNYYPTSYPVHGRLDVQPSPKLSEEMMASLLDDMMGDGNTGDTNVAQYTSIAYSCQTLWDENQKAYSSIIMPVYFGDECFFFIMLGEDSSADTTDMYVALGWFIGILFSILIALVIAKGFARTMRKEQELICRQRDYTNALAHDLKTPLMAISGYTENLQANVNPEKHAHYYEAIHSNIDYMSRLIMDMLSLAQLQRTEGTLAREYVDLRSMTETVTAYYEQELSEKNLHLEIEGSGQMEADPQLLERAIKNLVENAVKYSPAGERIRIRLEEGSLRITNTGVTLPKEKWDQVFQPFVKGDQARERESGTGLGLAIVRDIAELHDFQCKLECAGQATTVSLKC